MGWTSLTPSPFRRRLPHGMKADSGWIRYWITWRKTAAGLLNKRQSTFPGRIVPAQGTYLLWMDCKKLGLDDEQLKWVMADVAGIAPSMGSGFGPAGSGFIRLNLGCPRTYLEMAIDGLKRISVKTIKGIPTGG